MSNRCAVWLLVLIAVVHVSGSIFWVLFDERPPIGQDCIRHALNAMRFTPSVSPVSVDLIEMNDTYLDSYPPAHRTVLSWAYHLLGISKKVANGVSVLFFALLLPVVYAIGRTIRPEDPRPALLAAFVLGCFPNLFASSRFSNLSMMLTLFVALSALALIRSDGFRSIYWSAALGVFLGIGLLVKWTFVVFVAGPFLVTLLSAICGPGTARRLRNAAFTLAVAALVSVHWYWRHLEDVLSLWRYNREIYSSFYQAPTFSAWNLAFYAVRLKDGATPILAAVCVLAFVVVASRRELTRLTIPVAWILSAYVGLVFIQPKWPRYVVPLYPALALILGEGLFTLQRSRTRAALVGATVAIGLIMLVQGVLPFDVIASTFKASFFESHVVPVYPRRQDWGVGLTIQTIVSDWSSPSDLCTVAVLPKPPRMLAAWLNFESFLRGNRIFFRSLSPESFFWSLVDCDYIVTRTGPFLPMSWETEEDPLAGGLIDDQTRLLQRFVASPSEVFSKHYSPIAAFNDSEGQTITISKRVGKFSSPQKLELLETLSPIFREPEQRDIALRIMHRMTGRYQQSLDIWRRLEAKGLNRSWLPTALGPDLVDVLEVEDMVHNFRADIFAGRRVHGAWQIRRPSTQIAPVRLPIGKATFSVVAKAVLNGSDRPRIRIALDGRALWTGVIDAESPAVYTFENETSKNDGLLTITLLDADPAPGRDRSFVVIDKVIIRKSSGEAAHRG